MTDQQLRYLIEVQDKDLKQLQRELKATNKTIGAETEDASKRGHRGLSLLAKGAGGAALAIGAGLGVAAKIGFDELQDMQKAAAQTNAVLKSTHGAANVTAKDIDHLAGAVSAYSGMDDEAVQAGENLLLTFTQIQNRAGKGNDIFDQSVAVTADLAQAMGMDMPKAALQLGKALNDPERGMSRLQRIGVAFTDSQKDAVAALMKTGDTAGAQKIILAELNKEFGGSAEAFGKTLPGQLKILRESFNNAAGEIVGRFAPAIVSVAQFALPLVLKALDFVSRLIATYVVPTIEKLSGTFRAHGNTASTVFGGIQRTIGNVWGWIRDNVFPIIGRLRDIGVTTFNRIREVLQQNEPELRRIFNGLAQLLKAVGTAIVFLYNNVYLPLLKPLLTVLLPLALDITIKAIDLLVRAIGHIIDGFKWLGEHAGKIWSGISSAVDGPIDAVKTGLGAISRSLERIVSFLRWVGDHAGGVLKAFGSALGKIPSLPFGIGPGGDGVVSASPVANSTISPTLWDDLGLASAMGMTLLSGYRPGAITSTGHPSLHGVFPSKAIDVAGSPGTMAAFFRAELARGAPGIRELLYSPIGGYYPGVGVVPLTGSVLRDHYSHVHVGSYDRGGWLLPGLTLAENNTGRPERVLPGDGPLLHVDTMVVRSDDDAMLVASALERALGTR